MKNILKNSLYLFAFAGAGILFQISCSNSEENSISTAMTNKVVYIKVTSGIPHIFTCNYDGSNQTEVVLNMPPGVEIWNLASQHNNPRISPDGQKIFFLAQDNSDLNTHIYSANIDGSGVTQIVNSSDGQIEIGNIN
ncbi:TolB family protein [Flavobacterium sp. XGLA_31]|uniref:TolB family protein n=1 Tax=Flavobacterium sp. XGLA_31 TaxID=3447666 RepID=UPI003F3C2DE8